MPLHALFGEPSVLQHRPVASALQHEGMVMSFDIRAGGLKILVVHHDAIVVEDLCETLADTARSARVDRAADLSPASFGEKSYDAALIEVSRNHSAFEVEFDRLSRALGRIVWITDDLHPVPASHRLGASLRQPFRTEDVQAALRIAGILPEPKTRQ